MHNNIRPVWILNKIDPTPQVHKLVYRDYSQSRSKMESGTVLFRPISVIISPLHQQN